MSKYTRLEPSTAPRVEGVSDPTDLPPRKSLHDILLECGPCGAHEKRVTEQPARRPGSIGYVTECGACGARGYFPVGVFSRVSE